MCGPGLSLEYLTDSWLQQTIPLASGWLVSLGVLHRGEPHPALHRDHFL